MVPSLITSLAQSFRSFERALRILIVGSPNPSVIFCELGIENCPTSSSKPNAFNLEEVMRESTLWAVPKSRRSLEKRMQRKYGWPKWHWKPLVPRTNLLSCHTCGNPYEAGYLCSHCYNKVMDETKKMQDAVQAELGLEPVEKEVVVLYKGEREQQPSEFWEGKRIVELEKERPSWFSKNLLQKTTQAPATSTDIKPTELA